MLVSALERQLFSSAAASMLRKRVKLHTASAVPTSGASSTTPPRVVAHWSEVVDGAIELVLKLGSCVVATVVVVVVAGTPVVVREKGLPVVAVVGTAVLELELVLGAGAAVLELILELCVRVGLGADDSGCAITFPAPSAAVVASACAPANRCAERSSGLQATSRAACCQQQVRQHFDRVFAPTAVGAPIR